MIASLSDGAQRDLDALAGLDRVLDQVHDHALDLVGVAARCAAAAARAPSSRRRVLSAKLRQHADGARRSRPDRSAGARSMRGERENDSSESTTSRSRAISPMTCGRRRATRASLAGSCDDQLDRHPEAVERILQLVGDRRGGLAHRREPLGVDQRRLGGEQLRGPIAHPLLQQRRRRRAAPDRAGGSTFPCRRRRPRSARDLLGPAAAADPRRAPALRARSGSRRSPAPAAGAPGTRPAARPRSTRGSARTAGCRPAPAPAARGWRSASATATRTPPRSGVSACTGENANSAYCPFGLGGQRPAGAARGGGDRLRPSRTLGGARAIGRVDDLTGLVDQHGVGVARQVLVQRRRRSGCPPPAR